MCLQHYFSRLYAIHKISQDFLSWKKIDLNSLRLVFKVLYNIISVLLSDLTADYFHKLFCSLTGLFITFQTQSLLNSLKLFVSVNLEFPFANPNSTL